MSSTLHVTPVGDLVEHDTDDDTNVCVCGPRVQRVECETEGPDAWLIVHNSLDGREFEEQL